MLKGFRWESESAGEMAQGMTGMSLWLWCVALIGFDFVAEAE
jgi:hypothetical protein